MVRRAAVLVGWLGALAAAVVVLQAAGHGALAGPDLLRPATWADWASARTPADAAMAVLRLVGLGLAWYLLAATVLGVAVHLVGGARSVELADVVTLPFVRRVVEVGLGVGLTGAIAAAAGARPPVPPPAPTAADVALAADDVTPPTTIWAAPTPPPGPPAAQKPSPRTWVLQPGDHLWSVAERVVGQALGREPTEGEIHPYWQRLVEVNRPRLPVPSNPDLVWAGMEIEVPSAP